MNKILEKYLELKKIKYEKLYCKHDWEEKNRYDETNNITGKTNVGVLILFICKNCGKFKKFNARD